MRLLFFAMLLVCSAAAQEQPKEKFWQFYDTRFYWRSMGGFTLYAASGVCWGAREAYHADPYVFEHRWGVSETSFFGSDAWKRNYYQLDVDQGHKPDWLNPTRDVHHASGFLSKGFLIGGTFVVSTAPRHWKYAARDVLFGILVHSLFATCTYQLLRY